jgi:hypothetical protein
VRRPSHVFHAHRLLTHHRFCSCDPEDFPTADYIARYREGYENSNLTTWAQLTDNAPLPANRLLGGC